VKIPSVREQTYAKIELELPITHRDLVMCALEELENSRNVRHDSVEHYIKRAEIYARLAQSIN
jgi:hypothetical protein